MYMYMYMYMYLAAGVVAPEPSGVSYSDFLHTRRTGHIGIGGGRFRRAGPAQPHLIQDDGAVLEVLLEKTVVAPPIVD